VAVIVPCVLGARVIAGSVLQAPELESGLRIASVLVLLNAFSGVQVGVLSGLESFRSVATLTAIEGCLTLLFVVGGAWSFGLDGAIAGSVAAPALLFWFKHQAMRKASDRAGLVIRSRPGQRDWPIILSVVAPAILIGVSAQPFEWLGRVLLARTPGGYAELGIFTAAYAWGQIVSMATAQVTSPVVPILANVFAEKDGRAVSRLLRLTAAAVAMIGLGVVGPVMLLSSWIMRVYGHGFAGGAPVLIALAAAYGLASLSGLFRSTLVATGRLWTQNLHAAVWGAVLIGTFVLQSKRDALALALSYLAAYAVVVFTQGVSVWRALRSVKRGGAPTLA
jgi:O-antigen/teichoic acid export membrane protein